MHLALVQTLYRARVSPNVRKFPLMALCGIAVHAVVCRPVLVGSLFFLPTQGFHFQVLHPLFFLFICTLHWCKHCTGLEVEPNLRKFPLTALYGVAVGGDVCRPVQVCAFVAPNASGFTF